MTIIAPINLHFEDSGNWYSLPEWAEYFINVGKQLAFCRISPKAESSPRLSCLLGRSGRLLSALGWSLVTRRHAIILPNLPILRSCLTFLPGRPSSIAKNPERR